MVNIVEKVASIGMGKLKQAKARKRGLTGVFERLSQEHGEVAALLARGAASSDMDKLKHDIFPKVRQELLSHERGELEEVYPAMEGRRETQAIAKEHAEEASEMESLIAELAGDTLNDETWRATFERLAHAVKRHSTLEEDRYFPEAQQVLGEEKAKQLEEGYLRRKQEVMKELA